MRNEIILDLETKNAPRDWAAREELKSLGVSVAGIWSLQSDSFRIFREEALGELSEVLKTADRLVGFAIKKFDIPVLQPYMDFDLDEIPAVDMFEDISATLGHRISLASLAKATLSSEKSGHGLEAVAWFKNGDWAKLEEYCLQDVRLTRDLYQYGQKFGHLLFESMIDRKVVSVPVLWGLPDEAGIRALINKAHDERRVLEISYVSREDSGDGFLKTRRIEIQSINGDEIEAYDDLRQDVRRFRIGRIVSAKIMNEPAKNRPVVQSLFS